MLLLSLVDRIGLDHTSTPFSCMYNRHEGVRYLLQLVTMALDSPSAVRHRVLMVEPFREFLVRVAFPILNGYQRNMRILFKVSPG